MKKIRRVVGYISLAVGGVAVIFGISPVIPTILDAVFLGGAFFGIGAWALGGPRITSAFRAWKVRAGSARINAEKKPAVAIDPLLPVRILKLAREKDGTLTVSETAISLTIPLEQAEEGLKACVRSGNAIADFEIPRGYAVYRFPEFLSPEERKLILE